MPPRRTRRSVSLPPDGGEAAGRGSGTTQQDDGGPGGAPMVGAIPPRGPLGAHGAAQATVPLMAPAAAHGAPGGDQAGAQNAAPANTPMMAAAASIAATPGFDLTAFLQALVMQATANGAVAVTGAAQLGAALQATANGAAAGTGAEPPGTALRAVTGAAPPLGTAPAPAAASGAGTAMDTSHLGMARQTAAAGATAVTSSAPAAPPGLVHPLYYQQPADQLKLTKQLQDLTPKLTWDNYDLWDEFIYQRWSGILNIRAVIEGAGARPTEDGAALELWDRQEHLAKAFLLHTMSEKKLCNRFYSRGRPAQAIYTSVKRHFVITMASEVSLKKKELLNLKQNTMPLDEWFQAFKNKRDHLRNSLGTAVPESDLVFALQGNINPQFRDTLDGVLQFMEDRQDEAVSALVLGGVSLEQAQNRLGEHVRVTADTLMEKVERKVRHNHNVGVHHSGEGGDNDLARAFHVLPVNTSKPGAEKRQRTWRKKASAKKSPVKSCYTCGSTEHLARACTKKIDEAKRGDDQQTRKLPYCLNERCTAEDGDHHTRDCSLLLNMEDDDDVGEDLGMYTMATGPADGKTSGGDFDVLGASGTYAGYKLEDISSEDGDDIKDEEDDLTGMPDLETRCCLVPWPQPCACPRPQITWRNAMRHQEYMSEGYYWWLEGVPRSLLRLRAWLPGEAARTAVRWWQRIALKRVAARAVVKQMAQPPEQSTMGVSPGKTGGGAVLAVVAKDANEDTGTALYRFGTNKGVSFLMDSGATTNFNL